MGRQGGHHQRTCVTHENKSHLMGKQCFLSSLSLEGLHPHVFQSPFFRNHVIWTKDPSPTGVCFVAILSIQRPENQPATSAYFSFKSLGFFRLVVRLHNASLVARLPTLEPLRKDPRWKRPLRVHRNLRVSGFVSVPGRLEGKETVGNGG